MKKSTKNKPKNKAPKQTKLQTKPTKQKTKKGGNNIRKNLLDNKSFDFKISNTK